MAAGSAGSSAGAEPAPDRRRLAPRPIRLTSASTDVHARLRSPAGVAVARSTSGSGHGSAPSDVAAARIDRMLRSESVVWLSTVARRRHAASRPDLVQLGRRDDPDREQAEREEGRRTCGRTRRRCSPSASPTTTSTSAWSRASPSCSTEPALDVLPAEPLRQVPGARWPRSGCRRDEFLATYSQVIRIRPTRFLPWHGRTAPASETGAVPLDRRLRDAIRHVAATVQRGRGHETSTGAA